MALGTWHVIDQVWPIESSQEADKLTIIAIAIDGLSEALEPPPRMPCRHHHKSKYQSLGYRLPYRRASISGPSQPHVYLLTTCERFLLTSTCCFLLIFSNISIYIPTFAGSLHGIEEAMKKFTGFYSSAVPRNVQVQSPISRLRLVDGSRRGMATGGHYSVPKPFNEPNVCISLASTTGVGC